MAQIMQYPIDETVSDCRDHIRKCGYQIRGMAPVYHQFLTRGTRVSTIAAISSEGLTVYETLTGTTNGDTFFGFLAWQSDPLYAIFPSPKIMDNCSIHHVNQVKQLLDAVGIVLMYLPPYSPDYNP